MEAIDEDEQRTWTHDPEYLHTVRAAGGADAPAAAAGHDRRRLLSNRRFDDDDERVMRELAGGRRSRSTTRACTERRTTSPNGSSAALPPYLPEIRGVEIAARFRPAGDRNEVGGDFYDIFQTGPNRWAITIGDVCGKGPDAAATTPGRHTCARARSAARPTPDELLRALNDAMLVDNPTDFQFCTVAFADLEVGNGLAPAGVERRSPVPDRAARRRRDHVRRASRARCSA